MTSISMTSSRTLRVLLVGCSGLALAVPASANDVIFTSSGTQIQPGKRVVQPAGITQIKLTSGAIVSITQGAEYTINDDGSIDLHKGSITVTGAPRGSVDIRMPGGLETRVTGKGSSASFSVDEDGVSSGHTLTGVVRVSVDGKRRRPYREGQMWSAKSGEQPSRTFANSAVEQPSSEPNPPRDDVFAISGDAGPVNAALNGIPVTLGDGLAAAGASSDIVDAGRRVEAAVANPTLNRFPSGDLALLVASAAQLESAYGAAPFNGAQADVIRTYLSFLASGASGAEFLTAYSNFTLSYLELIRAGGVPSGFANGVASAADIDAYLAFIGRTGAISTLAAQDRALADAYLAFLASGQNRDLFASSFTDLTTAYFAFLRSGGVPTQFTGASQDALAQSIAFLQQSGLLIQLSAADQALVTAFLDNGGIEFAGQFQLALADYFTFLASGQQPGDYAVLDQVTLRAYLETLSNTGLLSNLQSDQAQFYADYLAFLRSGGDVDAFAGLPANIFAGYQTDLSDYFAFLENGGIPSAYTPLSQEVIAEYIAALEAAGATQAFLGDLAGFYQDYFAFLSGGGNPDNFAGLPVPPDFPAFASALNAYAAFLSANGLPSDFTGEDLVQLQEFFNAVQQSGQVDGLLGDNGALLSAFFAFLNGGGAADGFAGLPIYLDYVAQLNAYFAFLEAGNLPSEYTVLDAATIEAYLAALDALQGGLGGLADLNTFFANYYDFLLAGNDPDLFGGLPGMDGGNGSGSGNGGNPTLVYNGGFTPQGTGIIAAGSWSDEGRDPIDDAYTRELRLLGPSIYDAVIDDDGGLEQYIFARNDFIYADRGTAQTVDINGDEDLLIGRWTNGTYQRSNGRGELFGYTLTPNQGFHYLLANGFTGPANYPTGRVNYELLAATAPTLIDGSQAPGVFEADAAIVFGSSAAFVIDGSISFDDFTYFFATPGGIDGDGSGIFLPNEGSGSLGYFGVAASGSRGSEFSGQINIQVQIPDAEASKFGIHYTANDFNLSDPSDQIAIVGAAIFGAVSDNGSGSGTGGGGTGGNGTGFTGTRDNQVYYTFLNGSLASGFGGSADFVDGEVTGFASLVGTVSSNDAQIVEATDLEQIAWARWTNGTVQSTGLLGNIDSVIGPNGGYHVMTGEVTTSLPGGTIAYELIGGTSATDNVGSVPGSVTGDLAIAFGSVNRVGYDLTMALGGRSWAVSTTGGAADPGSSEVNLVSGTAGFTFGGAFTNSAGTVTSTGDTCAPSCFVNVSGTLYGDNAAYAALAMNVTDTNSTGVVSASGLAIFGQEGAASSIVDPVRNAAALAPVQAADWSRWTSPSQQGGTLAPTANAPLTSPTASVVTGAVDPAQRAAAIADIHAIMGGTITWGNISSQQ